jgi:predicted AAA+ superfamily ATPase
MIRRHVRRRIRALLREYPAVAIVGPRQSGKTTQARLLGREYFDLEQDADRLRLDISWDAVIASRAVVVLDEAQSHPTLFPRLRGAIDADRRRPGRFLLLGSVSPALMREVSESLAGRLAIVELTPLLSLELPAADLDDLWLYGGYPDGGVLGGKRYPDWQRNYLRLLAERDLPTWGLPAKPQETMRLVHMLAATHGTVWNASEIGRSLGASYHTVNSYCDFLESAFLIRRLPAFAANLKKRLVRSPKLYWRDSGLVHALLGGPSRADLLTRPWVGASWEGFVIEQLLSSLAADGHDTDASHLRTSDGHEVDLILDVAGHRWAIEIKLTSSPSSSDLDRLRHIAELASADRLLLISRTTQPIRSGPVASTNLRGALTLLKEAE